MCKELLVIFHVFQPKNDLFPLLEGLQEYKGILSTFPEVVSVQRVSAGEFLSFNIGKGRMYSPTLFFTIFSLVLHSFHYYYYSPRSFYKFFLLPMLILKKILVPHYHFIIFSLLLLLSTHSHEPLLVGEVRSSRLSHTSLLLRPSVQQYSHSGGVCPQIQC